MVRFELTGSFRQLEERAVILRKHFGVILASEWL